MELRLTALNRQRSHCHRLVQLMIGEEGGKQNGGGCLMYFHLITMGALLQFLFRSKQGMLPSVAKLFH